MAEKKLFLAVAAAAFAAVGVAPAFAQDSSEEVVMVTAQKREQNLQEVAAAVSVVNGAALDSGTAYNIEGIQNLVPTLNFRKGGTNLNSSLFLRGVGTINFSIAAEPSVAYVLDGVVLGRAGEAFGDLYDIERIEVLRGPQGTLFGKNASAGVVNVVSRMPGAELGGRIDVSGFEGQEYKVRGAIDLPVSDTLRTRFTAFAGQYDGNITNLFDGEQINGYDRWGVRGIGVWDAAPNLTFTLIGDYRKADDNCCGEVIGTAPTGAAGPALVSLLDGVNFAGDETRQVRHNLVTRTQEESWGLSLQGDYELAGGHTLTSITAYRSWDNTEVREGDWLDQPAAYVGNAFAQLHDFGPQQSSTFSQEIRLASPSNQPLEYVVGVYYYAADADRLFRRDDIVCTASALPPDATGSTPCDATSTFTTPSSTATFGSEFRNWAVFGQGSYHLTDRLTGIFGLRYTNDQVSFSHDRVPSLVAGPGVRTDTSGFRGSADKSNVSGTAGVQFDVTDDMLAYATYTRGYKGPAFNVFFNQNAQQTNVIDAETADAYEIGLKNTLFDGRLLLNIAAYDASYDNFQANNFDVLNGVVITRLTNAGNVRTSGIDIDFLGRLTDNLSLTGGYAYNDARIDCFNEAINGVITCTNTRKGEPLALAPHSKGSIGLNYNMPIGENYELHLNGNYSYVSSQYSDLGKNPALLIHGYGLLDASIGLSGADDRYRVTLVGRNLTDESFASLITPGGPGGALRYLIPREADRYFGVTLTARFGGE